MAPRTGRKAEPNVNLTCAIDPIHRVLSSAVCDEVFRKLRSKERARKWTLEAMLNFWVNVVTRAPTSLRAALDEYSGIKGSSEMRFEPSPSSYFERAQNLSWTFFRGLFDRFVQAMVPESFANFEVELQGQLKHFSQVWIVDGSSLARVSHRLKATRDVPQILLPGSVIVCHDLFRGIPRVVEFHEKLLGGEAARLRALLDGVPQGTLLVADRGYSSVRLLDEITSRKLACIVRMKRNHAMRLVQQLASQTDEGHEVTDCIVILGQGGPKSPQLKVRVITKRLAKGETLRLVTTELDPVKLPALVALAVYRRRWKIERLFYDLKEVLNLSRFYAANTNAVAMQVYASAIVYVALRMAQGRIAHEHGRRPEELSIAKLFPRVAAAHVELVTRLTILEEVKQANPHVKLVLPGLTERNSYCVPLRRLLVEVRKGPRPKTKYSKARTRVVLLSNYERKRATAPPAKPRRKRRKKPQPTSRP